MHDRGMSLSRSPVKRGERRHKKKQHMDGETDDSGSHKISDDHKREDKVPSYDEKNEEQLKQLHSEIERLEDRKSQVEIFLEEKVDEVNKLSKRNEELEIQLNKEQEDCKRITSKIKKFVRAHGRYLKAQEELKRSQARFERLGDQLGSDILKPGANEEDSSVNILSDVELNGGSRRSPMNDEMKNHASPFKKRTHVLSATSEEAKTGNSQKRGRFSAIFSRSEKLIRSEGPTIHPEMDNKDPEPMKAGQNKKDVHKSLMDDYKMKRGKVNYGGINPSDKVKSSEGGRSLPSTSIAAHAADELIEAIETEEKSDAMDVYVAYENGASDNKATLPLPPPPVNQIAYKQYEADDEDVDVEKVDNEMLDIDLNGEVEIEE